MTEMQDLKQRLEEYLKSKFPQRRELSVSGINKLSGGLSYDTYMFAASWQEAGECLSETLVIQIEPEYGLVPPYDVRRQYELMRRVHGTEVPVPKACWLETDSDVLGRPFLVMEEIEGERLDITYRSHMEYQVQLRNDFVEAAVKIHGLDWQAVGLSVLGVPENNCQYAEREIERWEWVINSQNSPEPVLAELIVWLKRNIPTAERTTLCHGDYNPRNFLTRDGKIVAALDWEMVAIGDPTSDIGWQYMLMTIGRKSLMSAKEFLDWEWDETEFLRGYEEMAGVKVNEGSLFFWTILSYVKITSMFLAGTKLSLMTSGIEIMDLDMRQIRFPTRVPLILDIPARMLGF